MVIKNPVSMVIHTVDAYTSVMDFINKFMKVNAIEKGEEEVNVTDLI